MDVIILCGGKGTRLRDETEYKPKPMVEIGGKPILWHIMKIYSFYGIHDFIIGNDLAGAVPVELNVFNLAGQRVAEIAVDAGTSGRFSASWDGTDGSDRLLPPGLYLLRLKVEADEETDVAIAPLPLVY